jgi:hypothetical protein
VTVGILTFHHAANYGAVWQCLSLSQAVQSIGHDVEVIDFRHPIAEKVYRSHLLRSRHAPFNLLKAWRLARDLRQRTILSTTCRTPEDLRNIASRYDAIIVGSDEVWNIEGIRGWTPAYFLDFVPEDIRKISYAASTGHRINPDPHREDMERLLSHFHAISVRDSTSSLVMESLVDSTPLIAADPTLLAGEIPNPKRGSHITVYGGLSQPAKKWLRNVAHKQRLHVVSIGFSNRVGGKIRIAAGLDEWLETIGSAQAVVTTTFHGVLACIVHRRPFWVLPRADKATKVKDFLSEFDLQHRALDPKHLPAYLDCSDSINFDSLWSALTKQITLSKSFLQNSLAV